MNQGGPEWYSKERGRMGESFFGFAELEIYSSFKKCNISLKKETLQGESERDYTERMFSLHIHLIFLN